MNARIDTYVHGTPGATDAEAEADTIARARLYAEAGADCVYPIMAPADSLPRLAAAVTVPLNALGTPDGPSATRRLGELGAARITFGPQLQRRAVEAVRGLADRLAGR